MKEIKTAQRQLARAIKDLERAAHNLSRAGLEPQAEILDVAGQSAEDLAEVLAAL